MEAFHGGDEYKSLRRSIKKLRSENKPCGDYIQQLNQVMIRMEKEYGTMASYIFDGLDKALEEENDR